MINKNKKYYYIIFLFLFIFIITIRPTSAVVNIDECRSCHQAVKPLTIITKDCQVCHQQHGGAPPSTRDKTEVHPKHVSVDEGTKNGYCNSCHVSTPIDCKNCHNSHDLNTYANPNLNIANNSNNNSINNSNNSNNSTNNSNNSNKNTDNIGVKNTGSNIDYSICQNCHGGLPAPYGHAEFRDALKNSKHSWMNCETCHIPPFKNGISVDLHFKDLMGTPITASINLCRICHSTEYKGLAGGTHGTKNNTCVDCHNPHTTSIGNSKLVVPKTGQTSSSSFNLTGNIQGASNWLTTKFPILNNSIAMGIIFILIAVTISEYLLSKHDEGKKVAYKMVRIQADENALKTLEVKLGNQNISLINDILKQNGIDVLGMTMTKETNLYDYVMFINIGFIEETEGIKLIDKISKEISSLSDVNSVEITDKYEL